LKVITSNASQAKTKSTRSIEDKGVPKEYIHVTSQLLSTKNLTLQFLYIYISTVSILYVWTVQDNWGDQRSFHGYLRTQEFPLLT
jgi:hypothetical protein